LLFVEAATAEAQEKLSKPSPLKLVSPPKPFQRPTGTSASNPISSPSCASRNVEGQFASSTPSIFEIAQPPLRLVENVPSLSLRSLKSGCCAACSASLRDVMPDSPSGPRPRKDEITKLPSGEMFFARKACSPKSCRHGL